VVVIYLVIGIVACILLLDRGFRSYVSPQIRDIFENVPPFNVNVEPENAAARRVEFTTADGIQLRGSLLNADLKDVAGLVLFFPELHGNHWMAQRYCEAFIKERFAVLSFDFRNQGQSDSMKGYSPIHWMTEFEMADVEAALEFVESDPELASLPIVAFGISRGGVAALLAGCRYPRIRAVIADSAFGTMAMIRFFVDRFVKHVIPEWFYFLLPKWHVNMTLRQAVRLSEKGRQCRYCHLEHDVNGLESGSVLLISGGRDSYVTPEIAQRLRGVIGLKAELWIVPGAKHNMSRAMMTEEYDRRILAHAKKWLAAESVVDAAAILPPNVAQRTPPTPQITLNRR